MMLSKEDCWVLEIQLEQLFDSLQFVIFEMYPSLNRQIWPKIIEFDEFAIQQLKMLFRQ